jgi:peptide/nickel transport system ATP-binding protein
MVFQGAMNALNPVKTVGWQIAEAMEIHGIARGVAACRRVGGLLALVGIAPEEAARYPHQFSGGMRQRAIIAMALACEPKVILADEPTTALDVMVQDQILKLLVRLSRKLNLALILVTHDLGVVARICDRAAVMLQGRIVDQGPLAELHRQPTHEYTRRLFGAAVGLSGARHEVATPAAASRQSALLTITDLHVSHAAPRTIGDAVRRRAARDTVAVSGISLHVDRGEMVALVGQSGCGKTTTLQTVIGMVRAQSGSIWFDGTEVTGFDAREWRSLRRRIQMIYQDPYESLDVRFRVRDTVAEPLRIHGIGGSEGQRAALVNKALERVGLTPVEDFLMRFPHELSGGQRQRVAIAASIILRPALLLADEPVSMLDISLRTGILELLNTLRRDGQMGVLMITHDLSTAAHYADRIAVMHNGCIVEVGTAAAVIQAPRADYTRALIASIPNPDPDVRRARPA